MTTSYLAVCDDLKFPREDPKADYDVIQGPTFTDRMLISATQCWESSLLFAARNGQINSKAPHCKKPECSNKCCTSYCTKRSDKGKQYWRFLKYCSHIIGQLRRSIFMTG